MAAEKARASAEAGGGSKYGLGAMDEAEVEKEFRVEDQRERSTGPTISKN